MLFSVETADKQGSKQGRQWLRERRGRGEIEREVGRE